MTKPTAPNHTPAPSPWLGVLGVLVILAFAGLAVFDTTLHPTTAEAQVAESAETSEDTTAHASQEPTVTPLYASEAGAHAPTDAKPQPSAPSPEATSLFDTH